MINTDRAISDKKDDVLGRAAFSENLAKAIIEYNSKDSLVIGLEGAWGTGKTSIVNMVFQTLKKEKSVVLIKFNPWDYSDHENLYRQFFQNIFLSLKPFKTKSKNILKRTLSWLLDLGKVGAEAIPWYLDSTFPLKEVINVLEKLSLNTSSLITEKPKIQKLLEKIDGKIVIVIDDIDRLNAKEIRQIFQIVKSLGDLPNIVYLLAFDRVVVVEALAKVQTEKGNDYLEKIIQMPVVVPHVSKEQIQPILFEKLDKVIANQSIDFIPLKNHWVEIYTAGLGNNFKTLRDLARFLNILQIDFQLVKNEINFVDFIAVSVLKVFSSSLYSAIKENKILFTKEKDNHSLKTDQESETQMLNKILAIDPKQKDLVLALFPAVKTKIGKNSWGYSSNNGRVEKLVSSETFFDIYFQLSLPSGHIPQYLIDLFLEIEFKEDYKKFFLDLKEKGNIKEFLTRLEDYTDDNGIKKENISNLIAAIFDVADLVPDELAPMNFDFGNKTRFGRIIYQLQTKRDIKQDEYFEMVKTAVQNTKQGLDFVVREIGHWESYYRDTDKKYEPPFTKEQSEELKKMGLEIIKKAYQEDKIKNLENIYNILFRWEEWEGDTGPKKYVEKAIGTQKDLINFLRQTLSIKYSSTIGGYEAKKEEYFEFKSLSHFLSPETLKEKVSKIPNTKKNKDLLRIFNESYDKWQSSKNFK
ncbi:MAG: P-loop NTPase fold protein [Candidatus Gracilibacteria bacterium]